ncbi:MAG: hypothetical protein EPO48_06350 [Nevskiaceae bacterium]|jgi:hypothetical protein|nr:MAG: hypothetical protein EPO48_06350 [Nevskiaceae bacterium]
MNQGLNGSLRLLAMLSVLLLGALALSLVLDLLPATVLADTAIKGLSSLAILAVVTLVLGVLMDPRG